MKTKKTAIKALKDLKKMESNFAIESNENKLRECQMVTLNVLDSILENTEMGFSIVGFEAKDMLPRIQRTQGGNLRAWRPPYRKLNKEWSCCICLC